MRKNIKLKICAILIISIFAISGCGNTNENSGTYNQSKESTIEKKQEESISNENVNIEETSDREEATTDKSQTFTTAENEEGKTENTQTTSQKYEYIEQKSSETGKKDATSQTATTKQEAATPQKTTEITTTQKQQKPVETATTQKQQKPIETATTQKQQKPTETATTQKPQKPTETTTKKFGSAIEQGELLYTKYLSYLQEVLKYTNEIRAEAGVAPLVLDETLSIAASGRSAEMDYYNYFAHTRPDGSSCFNILDEVNVRWNYVGENIAWGYSTPKAVVEGWKNSPGHYENIVNPNFKKLGVGLSKEYQGTTYWTQIFTN